MVGNKVKHAMSWVLDCSSLCVRPLSP